MRYTQPPEWPAQADYSRYLKDKVTAEDYLEYRKLRKHLINQVPKLGDVGVDELLLKLSSYLNET